MQGRRHSPLISVVLSIALHGIAIWYLLTQFPLEESTLSTPDTIKPITITLAPAITIQSIPPKSEIEPKSTPRKPKVRSTTTPPRPPHAQRTIVATAPETIAAPQPEAPLSPPPLEEDFSSRIEAARKRRETARMQENASQTDSSTSVDTENQVALANINAQRHWMGMGNGNTGGLFEIRRLNPHDAEFIFRGWNQDASRNSMQIVKVEQGNETSVQIAVIKKMIEIIQKRKKGDFIWNSHRLGRELTLSARIEDSAELLRFLMREIFPEYSPASQQ